MKALFVGLGSIGQRHLRNLYKIFGDDLKVSAYRVRGNSQVITEKLELKPDVNLNDQYNIEIFTNLSEALTNKPDAVFICNPTSLHVPIALEAAKHGCNLFVEKSLSNSFDGVPELVNLVENKGLISMVAYQMRFHPCLTALHKIINSGSIGRILSLNAEVGEYLPGWHKYEDYRLTYAARHDLGGGAVFTHIHEFDYILWLLGVPKRVFAMGGHLSSLEIDVEDIASVSMEIYVDDHIVPVHLHQDFIQTPPTRICKVIGDKGKVIVDLVSLTLTHYGCDGVIVDTKVFPELQRNQLFSDEMAHFVNCLGSGEIPCVSIREGAQSLSMALAAKASLASGNVIDFEKFNEGLI